MNSGQITRRKRSRERGRIYDAAVVQAISTIADALDWICVERLQPVLYTMARHLMACDEMQVSPEVLDKLQRISVSSVGRILKLIRPDRKLPRPYPGRRADTSAQQEGAHQRHPLAAVRTWALVHHGPPDCQRNPICTMLTRDEATRPWACNPRPA